MAQRVKNNGQSAMKGTQPQKSGSGHEGSESREKAFIALSIALPFLFFGILEAGLRIADYRGDTSLFIESPIPGPTRLIPNPLFASRYFFYTRTVPSPSHDAFLETKPENGFRVFALGGSTAAGYPYGFNAMFSRVVGDVLEDVMPDRPVEVVNVATSAINTYTLADQIDEVLAHDPDALLIYSGHNEYYGALGVASNETLGSSPALVRAYLRLQRLKTFLLLREGITRMGALLRSIAPSERGVDVDGAGTLMERIVREQTIPFKSELYAKGIQQFEHNMSFILDRAEAAGVPVFLGSLASNVKDQPPFISLKTVGLPSADEIYSLAGEFASSGEWEQAAAAYEQAKDLDALRFRAPSAINQAIQNLSQREGVYYVPVHESFTQQSPNGLIGEDLMLEHLHPNAQGYFLMGLAFARALDEQNYLGAASAPEARRPWADYQSLMRISGLDHRVAWHRITILQQGWPFVMDPAKRSNYALTYRFSDPIDSLAFQVVHNNKPWDEAKLEAGLHHQSNKRIEDATEEFKGLIRNQPWNDSPHVVLARLLIDAGRFSEARPSLERAYSIDPDVAFTVKMLGSLNLQEGRVEEGTRLLKRAVTLAPRDAQVLYNLSGAYALQNDLDNALETAQRMREIDPGYPGGEAWIRQLQRLIAARGMD